MIKKTTDDASLATKKSMAVPQGHGIGVDTATGLIRAANKEYRACQLHEKTAYEHAVRAGELLLEGRELVPYGQRVKWLAEEFEGSKRTAYDYMLLAQEKNNEELQRAAKVGHLSIREALGILKPKEDVVVVKEEPTRGNVIELPVEVPIQEAEKIIEGWRKTLAKHPEARVDRYAKGGHHSVDRDEREKARERRIAAAPSVETPTIGDGVEIHNADFQEFHIQPGSAKLVLTDPPYDGEWSSNYAALATFAFDALEDGGYLASYSGDAHYAKFIQSAVDAGFRPYGFIWVRHRYGSQSLHYPKKTCPGKLVFIFLKGQARLSRSYPGELDCGDPSLKDDHEWQQALGEATEIIEVFTSPGDLVVDPCVGSGTVPLAAGLLGRRTIGIEKDEQTYRAAVQKVARELEERHQADSFEALVAKYIKPVEPELALLYREENVAEDFREAAKSFLSGNPKHYADYLRRGVTSGIRRPGHREKTRIGS